MTSPADLLALQEIDLRRDTRRALIADIESRLGETEALLAAREALQNAETELDRLRREQHDLDNQLQDLDAKVGPLEKKLYDGSVRNPKELTDFQKEVASLKTRRGKLDDQGLALLDLVEAAAAALAEAQETARRAEEYWQAEQEELRADKARAEADAARLQQDRDVRTKGMDKSALGLYENLRKVRQGRAVARIERAGCQGCRISLPSHVVQRVRGGDALVQCPSCERILVAV